MNNSTLTGAPIKSFNSNIRKKLFQIINNLKFKNNLKIEYYSLSFSESSLDYYWAEFKYGDTQYKVSMFYKDFDTSTGNIHVLPGAVQIWKKCTHNCNCGSICEFVLTKHTPKHNSTVYPECGWIPICESPLFWDNQSDITSTIFNIITGKCDISYKCNISSSNFYKDIIGIYSDILRKQEHYIQRHGHFKKYSLYKWNVDNNKIHSYFKIFDCKGYGFFAQFGGFDSVAISDYNEYQNGAWNLTYEKCDMEATKYEP